MAHRVRRRLIYRMKVSLYPYEGRWFRVTASQVNEQNAVRKMALVLKDKDCGEETFVPNMERR